MTMDIKTKKCASCGVEKSIMEFVHHGRSKDGYVNECKDCRAKRMQKMESKSKIEPVYHEELSRFTPRMLMEHLFALGYKGSLQIPHSMML